MLYSGTLTSLYKTLPLEAAPILEDAILKSRLRLYDAAEHVFNNELSAYSNVPVVAFEHAETLLHRYKCSRILAVLAKVYNGQTSEDTDQNDMHRLISLYVGIVKTLTEGTYEHTLRDMLRLQRDWVSKPVDEYTNVQVECIRKYRLACIFLGYSSNLITDDMKLIPKPIPTSTPPLSWQGLTDLRVSLVSQGRFMEAMRFSSTERSAGTAMEDYQTTCLLLQLAEKHRAQLANTKDEIPWRVVIIGFKMDLGGLFASLAAKEQAEMWLNNLEAELEECVSLYNGAGGTLRASDSLKMLSIEYYRLKMMGKEEPTKSRFQQLLILGQKMQDVSHIETENSHYLAIKWAEKLYPEEEFELIRTDIQLQTQKHFKSQGRVISEMTNISDILLTKTTSFREVARRIELLDEFDRRYPEVTLPAVKQIYFNLRSRLLSQAGQLGPRDLEKETTVSSIYGPGPSGFNLRREVSIVEPNEQTLEVKNILDQRVVADRELNLDHSFLSQPEEVIVPKLLQKLVSKEITSGALTESALIQLFGSAENNTYLKRDGILELDGKGLLQNLVGTSDFPLNGTEWAKRRPVLQSWLLDDSHSDYRIRQCLWVAIHNFRSQNWNLHYLLNSRRKGYIKLSSPKLVKADCVGKFVNTISPEWFEDTCEQINAIEGRVKLKELKLESSRAANHFERLWWIGRSILPQLYMNLFSCCYRPGEELNDVTIEFFRRADHIAREQMEHWRSVDNSQYFSTAVIQVATIAQYRIDRTVEDTLELLEEVELLFGTTLYEIDLGQSLDVLNVKSYMGGRWGGMGIWSIGKLAVRLLYLAITTSLMAENQVQTTANEKLTLKRQQWLDQLWQWVQRVKARTLAQSMGLDNVVPDSMLVEIQKSLNIESEEECLPPLELLPQVREVLRDHNKIISDMDIGVISSSFARDLQRFSLISRQLGQPDAEGNENNAELEQELSQLNQRLAAKPALQKLIAIADFLNQEEAIRDKIEKASDRFSLRIKLQRLRQEMRREPVLERMFRIREGRPVSNQDLCKIAASRQGKVVFVDWFTISSSIDHAPKLFMLLWRNGICKCFDLRTEHGSQRKAVEEFFRDKDVYLPNVPPTLLTEMDLENMAPSAEKTLDGELKPVLNCFELVKPLFEEPMVEPGDLLVLSLTEGFHNFPLHAIQEESENEDSEMEPLILKHPVVYVPSLSVLHKCFWARHSYGLVPKSQDNQLRSLVLGGIISPESGFQYGAKAVTKIGRTLNAPKTTFIGAEATLDNFSANILNSDVLHIHLHTNYVTNKAIKGADYGHLSQHSPEDVAFVNSPLDQAIMFNGTESNNELTARRIIELQLSKGAHLNLMACASGRQGMHRVGKQREEDNLITDEVMGLVPAFLFSGAGSVTSTLWPIMDEHGAVFGTQFFRAFVEARKSHSQQNSGEDKVGWIDLADIHQKAVLEMRRIYKQPSAWAGFVLSGYWKLRI